MQKTALEWIDREFGVFTTSIILRRTEEELRESHAERGWEVTGDLKPEYRLTFASHPDLREYASNWYTVGDDHREKRVPESLHRSRQQLLSWYVLNGRLVRNEGVTRVAFPITAIKASESLLRELHEPFNPRVRTDKSLSGSQTLVLWDTAAFFEYIGDPPEGLENRWPDDSDELSSDTRGEECPSCGRRFTYLSGHWDKNADCDFPELTAEQQGILNGLLLGGAYLNRTEATKRPHLLFDSTDHALVDWVADQLGILVSSVGERASKDEAAERIGEAFGLEPDIENTQTVYRLQTRSHPFFDEAATWAGRRAEAPTEFTPPDSLSTPPSLYKTLYLHRGSRVEYPQEKMSAVLRLNRIPTDEDALVTLFEPFDARVARRTSDDPVLVIEDAQEFFEYIGDPIDGHESLWGQELGSLFRC
jgi:hypothetical protein